MEAIGTMMLVLTIQLSVSMGSTLAPIAIGGALVVLVYAGGPISGAQYNPSVSLAILLRGKASFLQTLSFVAGQVAGGIVGAAIGGGISGNRISIAVGADTLLYQALLAELVYTCFLCFVVLSVATTSKAENNHYYGIAIGTTVMAGAVSVGSISGGAFNPAVALGLDIANGATNILYVLEVVMSELLGGALAAGLFYLVAPDEFESSTEQTRKESQVVPDNRNDVLPSSVIDPDV